MTPQLKRAPAARAGRSPHCSYLPGRRRPAAPQYSEAKMQIRVALPPGVQPGQVIQVRAPNGAIIQVRAPPGVPPGGTFIVNAPDAAPRPVQVQQVPQQARTYARPQPQMYRPPSQLRQAYKAPPKLYNTGNIYEANHQKTCEDACWKWTCCAGTQNYCAYTPCCCCCLTYRVHAIEQATVGIVEKFGKFQYVAEPGEALLKAPLGLCVPWEVVAQTLNMRVRQNRSDVSVKTRDNVFVEVWVVVTFRVSDPRLAAYKLNRVDEQLRSYVEDAARSIIAQTDLDDVFTIGDTLEAAVKERASARMTEYGYAVLDTLVLGIEPEPRVKQSMNEIEMQKRLKLAQVNNAEAQKAIDIKLAEARAEAKHLQGIGIARQRSALVEGFAGCVDTLNVTEQKKFTADATELLLTTQYMDLLDAVALGARTRASTTQTHLFLPTGIDAVHDMRSRLRVFSGAFT